MMDETDVFIVVARQKALADELTKLKTNVGKDGPARKTKKYKAERLQRIEEIWQEFTTNHHQIEQYVKPDTPYLTGNLPERTHTMYCELKTILEAIQPEENLDTLPSLGEASEAAISKSDKERGAYPKHQGTASTTYACKDMDRTGTVTKPDVPVRQSLQGGSDIAGLIRKQQAAIEGLHRAIPIELRNKPREFYQLKIRTIERRWDDIQQLHNQIHEQSADPEASGYNAQQFFDLEEEAQGSLVELYQLSNQSEQSTFRASSVNRPSALTLPNIVLPKFDGDYMKWRQFHDLFAEMVHRQSMANCQKMYYLKTSLVGEAEKLIRHIVPTEENYDAAWKIINDRFENKRLLVTAIMNKLMSQATITVESAAAIKLIHDTTQECLLALKGLGIDTSTWDPMLLHVLIKKLDVNTHTLWEQSIKHPKLLQPLTEFLNFLETRFQSLEALGCKAKDRRLAAQGSLAMTSTPIPYSVYSCKCCKGNHQLFACNTFLQLTPSQRLALVKKSNSCINCLRDGHTASRCSSRACRYCSNKHNSLLHLDKSVQSTSVSGKNTSNKSNNKTIRATDSTVMEPTPSSSNIASIAQHEGNLTDSSLSATDNNSKQDYVFLSTVLVKLINNNGACVPCRALLDSGSQVNIITERMMRKLEIPLTRNITIVTGIGHSKRETHLRANVELLSDVTSYSTRIEAIVLPQIVSPQPSLSFDISTWQIPKNIKLADSQFNKTDRIDLLIGAEFFHQLLCIGQIKLGNELPLLQNTRLGWIVTGRVGEASTVTTTCGVFTQDEPLEQAISKFWKNEELPISTSNHTLAEEKCEELFNQSVARDTSGRFIVKLPFSDDPRKLGSSTDIALSRFYALERKLARNSELRVQYTDFMNEYIQLGHMTEIDYKTVQQPHYFLPHHCVLKPDSSSTKLRVVFDASAKTSSNLSLNDIMYAGPTIQDDLFTILLRFRLPKFVIKADIQKMYRQIRVIEEDKIFQLIWWRPDPTQALKCYKLCTVTYGTKSAPYLAVRCLQKLAQEHSARYPVGSRVLQRDFYVDDAMTGADSLIEAKEIQTQLSALLREGGFQLRKWCSNNHQLLANIPVENQEVPLTEDNDEGTVKTLGLIWRPKSDAFCIKTNCASPKGCTKRSVASDIARLFDPLGIVAPVVIVAKLFLQELWELKYDWDAALPEEMYTRWTTYYEGLQDLNKFQIPRHVFGNCAPLSFQIHTFADASEKAYGAAVYIRSINKDGTIIVRLLCSKSRVAPASKTSSGINSMTIPRLELCAALLAAELSKRVKTDLNLDEASSFLWSDSQIVLGWINSNAESFQTFVGRRIANIQRLTTSIQWRHVRSADNPADVLSRGISPGKLHDHNLWKYGPRFLYGKESIWPPQFKNNSQCAEERKKVALLVASNQSIIILEEIRHSNSFRRLQRVTSYCLRFIKLITTGEIKETIQAIRQNRKRIGIWPLAVQELEDALQLIIKEIQDSEFRRDIQLLKSQNEVDKKSTLSGLAVFLDQAGLLRVGGRLQASILPYDSKHPMLLPYAHPFVKMLMTDLHLDNNHIGPQGLLAITRQRFWPIKGKNIARSIIQHCTNCIKAKPKMYSQMMGNLPTHRIQPARPFINCGVDFCGPLWVHYRSRGSRPQRCYLSIFCCFATKALHIEVVSELTTDAFIGGLKRFMSRRGHVKNIYCDNATNFVGARNQLEELKGSIYSEQAQIKIATTCSTEGIEFHFIPPRAPHFGGLWEAAVKSAKHLLVCKMANASLTYEELCTVTTEIEAILNSRPLTAMSNDPNDLSVLTPGHFLIGDSLRAVVDNKAEPVKGTLLTRWKLVSHIKKEFWNRWSQEYLNELQQRTKWKTQSKNIEPGTVVIIKEDNTPVMKWPLGRIETIHHGKDGYVRVADVRTKSGVLRRPIHKLAPLLEDHSHLSEPQPDVSAPDRKRKHVDQADIDTPNSSSKSTEGPIKQTKRHLSRSATLSLLIIGLLLPIISARDIEVTKFNNSSSGLHFQRQGTISLINNKWNLIIYYNLEPYMREFGALENSTIVLEHLGNQISAKNLCEHVLQQLKFIKQEVTEENILLTTKQNTKRMKRGALDIVGNIANSLFGVLDSKYDEDMSAKMEEIQSNEGHLLQLLKNHTSILDSTVNIMRQGQEEMAKRHSLLETQFDQLVNRINNVSEELYQNKLRELFSSWSIYTTLVIINIQRTQTAIADVLSDSHQGHVNHLLVSPQQLKLEVGKIRNHLPPGLRLPVEPEQMMQLYKLMSIGCKITTNHVIFKIELPLIGLEEFTLFKVIPIPAVVNKTLVAINPSMSYLAVSAHHDQYYPVTTDELRTCTLMNGDHYLCTQSHPVYRDGATLSICEISLLNNISTSSTCELKIIKDNSVWTKLPQLNQWIYAVKDETTLNVVCSDHTSFIKIQGSGFLKLQPYCVAKHQHLTLQGQHSYSSNVRASFTRLGVDIKVEDALRLGELRYQAPNISSYSKDLQELREQLRAQQLELPIQLHNSKIHHTILSSIGLLITIIVVIVFMWKYCFSACNQRSPPPIPAPRTAQSLHAIHQLSPPRSRMSF